MSRCGICTRINKLANHINRVYLLNIRLRSTISVGEMRDKDREKFVRLATKRVQSALKAIQLIGNLSNRSNYDYSDDDVQKIFRALQDELQTCRKKFDLAQKRQSNQLFRLE